MVLGPMEGVSYSKNAMVLQPGDRLLLYTDGVTEAKDQRQHLFSERRLEEFLASVKQASPEELTRELVGEVKRFAAGAAQSDDITILALQ
jgi:phosphoserine phosphatase RsbU/P